MKTETTQCTTSVNQNERHKHFDSGFFAHFFFRLFVLLHIVRTLVLKKTIQFAMYEKENEAKCNVHMLSIPGPVILCVVHQLEWPPICYSMVQS